jgi:hypothetical protein
MREPSLYIRVFSRNALDPNVAGTQLGFLFDFADHIFLPDECGPYAPFKPFDADAFARYVTWFAAPGGEFGFRCSRAPFVAEGYLANLDFPEMFVTVEGSPEPQLLPGRSSPSFRVRWSIQVEWRNVPASATSLIESFFLQSCRITQADFAFVALNSDYKAKHFTAVRNRESRIEQYLGDDPRHGIPGLYWMNIFGPLYADWFGTDRIAAASQFAETTYLPDGSVYLRFGDRAEASETAGIRERQRRAIQALADDAFFDIERPGRVLNVPPALRTK